MKLPVLQQTLYNYAANNTGITLDKAVELIGYRYFANQKKHTGRVLARMVEVGLLIREKPGRFIVNSNFKTKGRENVKEQPNPDQLNLFK